MMFRRWYIKWLVWRGKAVDIWSKSAYPANVLSNLHDNDFCYNTVICISMEGFLQSLKYKDPDEQRRICLLKGKEAKRMSTNDWQTSQVVWWRGVGIGRQSEEFMLIVHGAYRAMLSQNENFRKALMSTCGKRLYHSNGEQDPRKTILTEKEFCSILTDIRAEYTKESENFTLTRIN